MLNVKDESQLSRWRGVSDGSCSSLEEPALLSRRLLLFSPLFSSSVYGLNSCLFTEAIDDSLTWLLLACGLKEHVGE